MDQVMYFINIKDNMTISEILENNIEGILEGKSGIPNL
jgi:hypothetical protein